MINFVVSVDISTLFTVFTFLCYLVSLRCSVSLGYAKRRGVQKYRGEKRLMQSPGLVHCLGVCHFVVSHVVFLKGSSCS
jgi:hypothetical protein